MLPESQETVDRIGGFIRERTGAKAAARQRHGRTRP